MSDLEVNRAVRKRDGHKCRDCGMDSQEHLERYGKSLDVHRIIPGDRYLVDQCVTLCRACHGKKPKTIDAAYFSDEAKSGVCFMWFNLYDPKHKRLFDLLCLAADRKGTHLGVLLPQILENYVAALDGEYTI